MSEPKIVKMVDVIDKKEVKEALDECFKHVFVFKSKVFPKMVYHVSGQKIINLYERLGFR